MFAGGHQKYPPTSVGKDAEGPTESCEHKVILVRIIIKILTVDHNHSDNHCT